MPQQVRKPPTLDELNLEYVALSDRGDLIEHTTDRWGHPEIEHIGMTAEEEKKLACLMIRRWVDFSEGIKK